MIKIILCFYIKKANNNTVFPRHFHKIAVISIPLFALGRILHFLSSIKYGQYSWGQFSKSNHMSSFAKKHPWNFISKSVQL